MGCVWVYIQKKKSYHRTKSHVSVFLKCGGNMHKKWSGSVVYAATENARKRHETGNGNTGYPSCFQNGLTCFCHVSVYGFLQFRPVYAIGGNMVTRKQ